MSRCAPAVQSLAAWAVEELEAARVDAPQKAARLLLAAVLGQPCLAITFADSEDLSPAEAARFQQFVRRRALREPLAYITGTQAFLEWDFRVSPAVMVPRPETELLVETVRDELGNAGSGLHVLEVGTGCGNIAISLAKWLPSATICGVDIAREALEVAQRNAVRLQCAAQVRFFSSDLLSAVKGGRWADVVVANLPYVSTSEFAALQPEVAQWEPRIALDAGPDGLVLLRRLIRDAPRVLRPGGLLALEIGASQAQAVLREVERRDCYEPATVKRDYSGHDRIVTCYAADSC